jgi:CheY-like chemotaxis protein
MAQAGPTKPPTVLVVENEAIVRLELVDQFEGLGLIVLAAQDADEAILLLDSHPEIELLMTDIKMPGSMDGIRLAHHVRDRWPPVKIIVLSGMLNTQLSQLPGESIFLSKPYDPGALAEALSNMLNSHVPPTAGSHPGLSA